jgi:hypothetical protein
LLAVLGRPSTTEILPWRGRRKESMSKPSQLIKQRLAPIGRLALAASTIVALVVTVAAPQKWR